MTIVPPIQNQPPYDEVDQVLNFARVIANDAGVSIAGDLLSDDQPYTFTMLNLAWRKLQSKLGNNAVESFPSEVIIPNIPAQDANALLDPGAQSYLDYGGYFDGVSIFEQFNLPQDLYTPLRVSQRVSGQDSQFYPMIAATDGLSSCPKTAFLTLWEWRDDKIYFNGASSTLDLRIRYKKFFPDLDPDATTVIPLLRCAVALAYLTVEIFAAGRGSTVLPVFNQEKEEAIKQIINSTVRKQQRSNFRRIPYSRRGRW